MPRDPENLRHTAGKPGSLALQTRIPARRAPTIRQKHLRDRTASDELLLKLEQDLAKCFVNLGMTDEQELFLDSLVRSFVQDLIELFDRGEETQQALQELSEQLLQFRREQRENIVHN